MPKLKPLVLNRDVMSRYYYLGRELASMKKEREQLRLQIMDALDANRKPTKDAQAAFQCGISEYPKVSIPWEAEAERRATIAMKLARKVGYSPAQLKALERKLAPNYPAIKVRQLEIKPQGQKPKEDVEDD